MLNTMQKQKIPEFENDAIARNKVEDAVAPSVTKDIRSDNAANNGGSNHSEKNNEPHDIEDSSTLPNKNKYTA